MSWVSQANIKTIMTAIRNKFTTSDLVIANDAKDTGVELNYASQDGLVTVSPISTSASTEAALHLSNGDDTKKTELTQGTLSYVTGTGSSETYNYMSLLGDGVTFGKNGGGNVQLGGVADPTSAQQVATKNYVDMKIIRRRASWGAGTLEGKTVPANGLYPIQTFTDTPPVGYAYEPISALAYPQNDIIDSNISFLLSVQGSSSDGDTYHYTLFAFNSGDTDYTFEDYSGYFLMEYTYHVGG